MNTSLKYLAKGATPPFVWSLIGTAARRLQYWSGTSFEKSDAWYDQAFLAKESYRVHYTGQSYYFLWCAMVDRIMQAGIQSVLDIGCGSGQLAMFLRDKGLKQYCGIDFSQQRVKHARSVCPEFEFLAADAYEADRFETFDYDAVVCCEFLRHVKRDIEIVGRIRPGARFFGTQRNFPFPTRERHFSSCNEFRDRYKAMFSECRVDSFPADGKGKMFFLLDGIKA